MEDSPNDTDSSKGSSQDQSEDSCRNIIIDIEHLHPIGEHASKNQYLPSSRQGRVSSRFSSQPSTSSFQAPDIDLLEKTNADAQPSRELYRDNCSRNEDARISPRQPATFSKSLRREASEAKANQKHSSPVAASRNADFPSPPERVIIMGNRLLSKNLKETNAPSPEKLNAETHVELTPTKRLRKTSKSNLDEPGPIKRKRQITRNTSVQSKTSNNPTLSPSASANVIDKSPTHLQIQGIKVDADESPTERKTVILNPYTPPSCHLPRRSKSSVTNDLRPKLEFKTSDKTEKNEQNRSDSATRTSTPDRGPRSQFKELSALGHRRSVSDVTLTSRNLPAVQELQKQCNSLIASEMPTSRSLLDISNVASRSPCVVQLLRQGIPPRSAFNMTSATNNQQEPLVSGHLNQSLRERIGTLPSIQSSISSNNPEVQMQQNPNLQSRLPRFFLGETSRSGNQSEKVDTTTPHINVFAGEASTSNYQPTVTAGFFPSGQTSASRNQPDVANNLNPTHIDISQRRTSTSRYHSVAMGDSSSNDQRGRLSTFNPSRPDELLANSRFHLSSVLRRMMLYNGEDCLWGRFEAEFVFLTNSFTESVSLILCLKLSNYWTKKIFNSIARTIENLQVHGMTAETFTQIIYEKLLASVVGTLIFILSVPITPDSRIFIHCYSDFRSLYAEFLDESSKYNVDDVQDEASRNRVEEQQQMVHLLMLEALQAHQLLLMYVGENSDAASIQRYESSVRDEDKMYLRRRIG